MREEVNELKAELARRRLEEAKYSPSQPRVPRGNSRGGQWTDGGTGGSIAQPMGSVASAISARPANSSDLQIAPDDAGTDGEQVADVIRVCTVAGAGRATVDGVKSFFVIYECAGGQTFRREGLGHKFPGIVRDPFR